MSSKASFCLNFSQRSRGGLKIGLIGQRLPSRNPVHHTRSKMASFTLSSRNNGSQPAKAEITRERTLPSISEKKKKKKGYKNILWLKKSGKSEHFYVTHEHFFKKLALF